MCGSFDVPKIWSLSVEDSRVAWVSRNYIFRGHFRALPRPELGRNETNAVIHGATYILPYRKPEVDRTIPPPTVTSSKWRKTENRQLPTWITRRVRPEVVQIWVVVRGSQSNFHPKGQPPSCRGSKVMAHQNSTKLKTKLLFFSNFSTTGSTMTGSRLRCQFFTQCRSTTLLTGGKKMIQIGMLRYFCCKSKIK